MNDNRIIRLVNVALRGITLVAKFTLVFALAKFLGASDLGLYGLISATIGYGLYVLGFEFYNFATREMIRVGPTRWLGMIRDQAILFSLLYIAFLPLIITVFLQGWLPWSYFCWFIALLILEHGAQEANRILVAVSEQLLASWVLFLRSGSWCLVVVALMWGLPATRSLDVVVGAWVIGCGAAWWVTFEKLRRFDRHSLKDKVNWRWVGQGMKVAAPLLLASLAIRGIFTFDRYWVESVGSLEVLGAYVLFIGMATAILSFLDAGVIVFFYPRLVAFAQRQQRFEFRKEMKRFSINIVAVTLSLIAACAALSGPLLDWLGEAVYIRHVNVLYWLLLGVGFYALSMIPHVALYAFQLDRAITLSQVAGFIVFVTVAFFGTSYYGVIAVPWAICAAFIVILLWKLWACRLLSTMSVTSEVI